MRILIVEDEPTLAEALALGLRRHGHVVDLAYDGGSGLDLALALDYEVILLDRDLPVLHGDLVCRQLGEAGHPARILMLTAAADLDSKVDGLTLGADDYMTKPFAFRELLARIAALGRRQGPAARERADFGDLTIDFSKRQVWRGQRLIDLRPKEFGVLAELARAEGGWVSAERLLDRVWDANADPFSSAVKITMTRLRAKLGQPDLIVTERGVGYRLVAE